MVPFEDYLYGKFFGNTLLQYLIFFGLIIASILLGKTIYWISKTFISKIAAKTKTEFDDILVKILEGPFILLIVIIGFFIGYKQLHLSEHAEQIFGMLTKNFITIVIAWFVIRLVDKLIEHYLVPLAAKTETDLDDHLIPLLKKLAKYTLIIIAGLIVLSNFGINVTSAIAGLGIGGLAVALAAQETLKNVLGGIAILTDKPFKLGDWIEIDKYQGTVVEIGLRSTRLKTITGEYVTVPNSLVASQSTVNYLKFPTRRITFVIGLTYDTSPEKIDLAKKTIRQILENTDNVVKETIEINFVAFNNYSLDIDVRFEVKTNLGSEMRKIRDSINTKIKKEFEKKKIKIAYPTQTIELKK